MSKFCRQCGAELGDNDKFCGECGFSDDSQVQNQQLREQQYQNQLNTNQNQQLREQQYQNQLNTNQNQQFQEHQYQNQPNINPNQQINQAQGPCLRCGSLTPYGSNICNACGEINPHRQKDSHTLAIVLGYVFCVLSPLIGAIFAIYLLTRDNQDVKKHGYYQLAIAFVVFLFVFMLLMAS